MSSVPPGWVERVEAAFAEGPPNGWLLGWDEKRFERDLRQLADSAPVFNATSFDYAFCNKYEVEIRETSGEVYWILTIRISYIVDAYTLHWTEYRTTETGRVVGTPSIEACRRTESAVLQFLSQVGCSDVSDNWYRHRIPGIRLELGGTEATLGKCLFEDYEG